MSELRAEELVKKFADAYKATGQTVFDNTFYIGFEKEVEHLLHLKILERDPNGEFLGNVILVKPSV